MCFYEIQHMGQKDGLIHGMKIDPSSTTTQNNTLSSQPSITIDVVYVHTAGLAGPLSRPDAELLITICIKRNTPL